MPNEAQAQAEDEIPEDVMELFERSIVHYRAGRFARAAAVLEEAYAREPHPTLLYNLARAREGMGDLGGAVDAYAQYLEEVETVEDRGAIESRMDTLEQQIEEREELEAEAAQLREQREAEAEGISPWPWVVAGIGAAIIGGGLVLGATAQSRYNEAEAQMVHALAFDAEAEARNLATVANALFVAGGAVFAGGIVWGLIDVLSSGSSDEEEPSGDVEVALGLGNVTVSGEF